MAPERIFPIYKRREFTVNQITSEQKQSKADSKPNKLEKSKKTSTLFEIYNEMQIHRSRRPYHGKFLQK